MFDDLQVQAIDFDEYCIKLYQVLWAKIEIAAEATSNTGKIRRNEDVIKAPKLIENEIKHVKLTFKNTEGAIKKENPENWRHKTKINKTKAQHNDERYGLT